VHFSNDRELTATRVEFLDKVIATAFFLAIFAHPSIPHLIVELISEEFDILFA